MNRDEIISAEKDIQFAQFKVIFRADKFGLVEHYEVIAFVLFDLRPLVRVAAIFNRERVKLKLFRKLYEILARGVGNINPDDLVLVPAHVADVCRRKIFRKLLGRAIQTNSLNQPARPP
jgi:hypothetical protein